MLLLTNSSGHAAELLLNGSFDEVMRHWTMPPKLIDWIPYQHPAGNINLHPEISEYNGLIVSQSLNVTGIANQQVTVATDLVAPNSPPDGKTVAIYLEYLDSTYTLQRMLAINPDNSAVPVAPAAAGTFTGTVTFPANAMKLVRLCIEKEAYGMIYADNIHLTGANLTAGQVPHLGQLQPAQVAYGGSVVIQGTGLGGPMPPQVMLNGTTDGLTVTGWTPATITVQVNPPAASGLLSVSVLGTPAVEMRHLTVTSPHYVPLIGEASQYAISGQPVDLNVQLEFRNGFTPTGAGVNLQLMKNGVPFNAAAFAPNPVPRNGGSRLTLDTTGLAGGKHTFAVRAVNGAFQVDSFFDVFMEVPAGLNFFTLDASWQRVAVPNPLVLTTQGKLNTSWDWVDAEGNVLNANPALVWSTTNPLALDVFSDPTPWGGTQLLVKNDGSGVLRASAPGGRLYEFPFTVDVPDSPRIVSCTLVPSFCDNSGSMPENTLYYEHTSPLNGFSYGVSGMTDLVWGDGGYGVENRSYTGRYRLTPGQAPGQYLWHGTSNGMTGYAVLTVYNAADKGMVTGHVASFGGGGEPHMQEQIYGKLEFYDPATETKLFEKNIWEWGKIYHAAYIAPGSYKLRWVPNAMGPTPLPPQWYPLATSHSQASAVTVTAGGELSNIHFFLSPEATTSPPPAIVGQPTHNPSAHTFGLSIQTELNGLYQLQRSDSMLEGTWFNVGNSVWGDGAAKALTDDTATGTKAFYRVVRE